MTTPTRLAIALTALALPWLAACHSDHPAATASRQGWSSYGNDRADEPPIVSAGMIRDGEAAGEVTMTGVIRSVCLTKGCWMTLADDGSGETIFVRFRDYSFFVPRNAVGRKAVIRGTPIVNTVSVALLRHYAEDAGKSQAEIDAITAPETRLEFIADSVLIQGGGLQAPYRAPEPESCDEHDAPDATPAAADTAAEPAPASGDTSGAAPHYDLP